MAKRTNTYCRAHDIVPDPASHSLRVVPPRLTGLLLPAGTKPARRYCHMSWIG